MLPHGYSARPPVPEDIAAVTELENERWRRDTGRNGTTVARVRMWWDEPARNLSTDNLVITGPSEDLAAYADYSAEDDHTLAWLDWAVGTAHLGQGLEEYLLEWLLARARQDAALVANRAGTEVEASVADSNVVDQEVLRRAGFEQTRVWLRMQIELEAPPPQPVWPPGISVRTAGLDEVDAIHAAWEDAQADEYGFTSLTDEEFRYYFVEREAHFDPTLWFLAIDDGTQEIAGYTLCRWERPGEPDIGHVRYVAVRAPYRRRGIARALLLHAFDEFYRRGKPVISLGVDATSLTGADRLYASAGMRAVQTSLAFTRTVTA
jgi:mycothiol synthase